MDCNNMELHGVASIGLRDRTTHYTILYITLHFYSFCSAVMPRNSNSQTRRPWECESESLGRGLRAYSSRSKKTMPKKTETCLCHFICTLGGCLREAWFYICMSCMFWRREYSYARSCLWRANMAGERRLNPALATTAQQLRFSNHGSATNPPSRFRNYASATTLQQPKLTLASATTLLKPKLTLASATKIQKTKIIKVHAKSHLTRHIKIPTPSGKYMQSHILHVISKSHPLWQVHAKSHLRRHIKIPTPSGKYMQSHTLHVISKSQPPLASTCKVTSYTSYQIPHPLWQVHAKFPTPPSGKHMQSHILHVISKSQSPTPLASTCTVTSYTSYQNPTPSGKYMQSIAKSHLTRHIKIPTTSLGSTCKVTSYTSYQNPIPLWQVHAKSHLTRHIKIPTPSGKQMQSHILHVTSKSHPLWQVHAKWHLTRHIKIPLPLASTCKVLQSHILHVISKSQPLWEVHAKSHLTRHIKIPSPLASTCKVTSYTSYQNPNPLWPSGQYMQSDILHVISKSHSLWQVHAKSHLTRHIKIPSPSGKYMQSHILDVILKSKVHAKSHLTRHIKIPSPLASTCKVTSYTSYQNPTPSGKYQSHILHVISKSHPLWQVHAKSHLTRHIKFPTPSGKYMRSHILHVISNSYLWQVHAKSHRTRHIKLLPPLASTCKGHGLRNIVYESWFTEADVNQRKDVQMPNSFAATTRIQQGTCKLS